MEHFIKNIEITNFKSIRHAEIKDCRRVNVFVGPPNVGKSNILEAMSLFSITRDLKSVRFKDLVRVTEDPTIFYNGNIKLPLTLTINNEFKLIGSYRTGDFYLSALNLQHHEFVTVNVDEEPFEIPIEYNTVTFKKFDYVNHVGRNMYSLDDDAFPYPKKYQFHKHVHVKLGDFSTLSYPFGENLFSVIQTNSIIRKELSSLLKPYNLKMLFDSGYQSFSLLKTIDEENVFSVDYSLIADTLQRLFFYKAAILSNKNEVLLFEEPEAHCYEPYILEFTNAVKRDQNSNQFFIVTHSQYVIEEFLRDEESRNDTNIYMVGLENNETKIKLLSQEMNKEIYQTGLNVFFNYQSLWNEITEHEAVH